MGVDTKLYVNNKFSLEDVINVIKHHVMPEVFGIAAEQCDYNKEHEPKIVASEHNYDCGYIVFGVDGNKRSMWYYLPSKTPLGPCKSFSLGHNDQAIKIMTIIAEVLGGIVQEQDSYDAFKMYRGKLDDENGLSFFVKNSVICNQNDGEMEDIDKLQKAINDWRIKYKR